MTHLPERIDAFLPILIIDGSTLPWDTSKLGGVGVRFGDHLCVDCTNVPWVQFINRCPSKRPTNFNELDFGWVVTITLQTTISHDPLPKFRSLAMICPLSLRNGRLSIPSGTDMRVMIFRSLLPTCCQKKLAWAAAAAIGGIPNACDGMGLDSNTTWHFPW